MTCLLMLQIGVLECEIVIGKAKDNKFSCMINKGRGEKADTIILYSRLSNC